MPAASSSTLPPASGYRSVFREGLFAGKVIIVTGAGSGLGRCTAHELASLGATLALVGRSEGKLKTVQTELAEDHRHTTGHKIYSCDIRNEQQVRETIASIVADLHRIDGLFNCAGGQFPAKLEKISLNGWDAVVRNNLHGTFLMSRECYTQWMEHHGGTIVNMLADIWGGMPGMGHSGAARAGVWNFTETAACEWGHAGVRVNAVAPGWIASAGMDSYNEDYQALLRTLKHKVPLQRFGTESELASAAVFLLSEASAFINGTVIRVDGGVPNARHSWPLPQAERTIEYNGFPRYQPPAGLQELTP
ncbi:citronellol/citronellal dehydrogenase [Burkholderia sp. WP9]|jgi:citronellol/citronellal dehydrogenase|uniref:SDR family oxidoreductase n=1 Tax=Burkholderiaceae TaxID=119060 RepID=UPI00089C23A5|nr:SDR family oxidoreductase [Burkholderia sp. WP9]SEB76640.1 citronellol/citronellal dehydrogenase [Burkholderia sp. WP9]